MHLTPRQTDDNPPTKVATHIANVGDMSATTPDTDDPKSTEPQPRVDTIGGESAPSKRTTRLFQKEKTAEHTLSTRDVANLLGEAGFSRSRRSVERYCVPGKLDAYFDSFAKQYWITKSSVELFINLLKENTTPDNQSADTTLRQTADKSDDNPPTPPTKVTTHSDSVGDMSATTTDAADQMSAKKQGSQDTKIQELESEIESMERELRNLRITDQVKDGLLKKNEVQFKTFLDHLEGAHRKVGMLESENSRLKSLPAGDTHNTDPDVQSGGTLYEAETNNKI